MTKTAFGGRRLGEAADVLEEMVRDRDCFPGRHGLRRDDRSPSRVCCSAR